VGNLLKRNSEPELRAALEDTPVVVLTGARQTGKSTLAKAVRGPNFKAQYVTLDDLATRSAALSDPEGFIAGQPTPLVIDEVQHAPLLFPAIKKAVDEDRRPGMFLLTGSANVLLLPKISESLAGRSQHFTLWPFSQGELAGRRETFADRLFQARSVSLQESGDLRRDLLRRALRGGFPEIITRPQPRRRGAWFQSYVQSLLERDVRELSKVEGLAELPRLLSLLAARSASILNNSELSRVLGLNVKTLGRYLTLLERLYLVAKVPSWSGNLGHRVVQHPKIVITDTGLLAHLQGVDLARYDNDPTLAGGLLETFVVTELLRQTGWQSNVVKLHHFRSHTGEEADIVLERRDGSLVGIEVKAAASVDASDLRGLRALGAAVGRKFVRGVLLYTGRETVPFAANLHALPMSALWKI